MKRVTVAGWEHMASCLPNFRSLRLRRPFDCDLEQLSPLSRLERLEIPECEKITSLGIMHLSRLSSLQSLELYRRSFSPESGSVSTETSVMSAISHLRSLSVTNCSSVFQTAWQHVSLLSALTALSIFCLYLNDADVSNFSSLTSLRSLCVDDTPHFTDASMPCIARLTGLRKLELTQLDGVSAAGYSRLTALSALRELRLHPTGDDAVDYYAMFSRNISTGLRLRVWS